MLGANIEHLKVGGNNIKLSELFRLLEKRTRENLKADLIFGSFYTVGVHGHDVYFHRVQDKVNVSLSPEILYSCLKDDLLAYNYEIQHDPHMLVMPVEID